MTQPIAAEKVVDSDTRALHGVLLGVAAMHTFLTFMLIAFAAFNAHAQIRVSNSTSPDRKAALYYRYTPSTPSNGTYQFYFRNPKALLLLSKQLVPDVREKVLGVDPAVDYDWESGILFGDIGADNDARRHSEQRDPAFSYFVAWSPDSRWVSIEGGEHKFWHLMIYHLVHGRFERVELPTDLSFIGYFHVHLSHPKVKELGASEKIPPRDYDPAKVCWLGNGIVAVDTYPYLLREEDYYSKVDVPFYFLDCRTKPGATILGFCR